MKRGDPGLKEEGRGKRLYHYLKGGGSSRIALHPWEAGGGGMLAPNGKGNIFQVEAEKKDLFRDKKES